MPTVKPLCRSCEEKKVSCVLFCFFFGGGRRGRSSPDLSSIRNTKLFKSELLNERGNLTFVAVGTGSKMFGSGKSSFERAHGISCVASVGRGIPFRAELEGHELPDKRWGGVFC